MKEGLKNEFVQIRNTEHNRGKIDKARDTWLI